jgi:hypothetical protein
MIFSSYKNIHIGKEPGTKNIYYTLRNTATASFCKNLLPCEGLKSVLVKIDT